MTGIKLLREVDESLHKHFELTPITFDFFVRNLQLEYHNLGESSVITIMQTLFDKVSFHKHDNKNEA